MVTAASSRQIFLVSPVFAFVFVRHGTSLAAPAVIAVTLGVQTRTIDTTVPCGVQAVI